MRVEAQPGPGPQPDDQVISRRIGPCLSPRLCEQVDEDIVTIGAAVLFMQVVGIKPDQVAAGGNRPAAGLGAGAVRVLPGNDADLPLGRGDVLMPQA